MDRRPRIRVVLSTEPGARSSVDLTCLAAWLANVACQPGCRCARTLTSAAYDGHVLLTHRSCVGVGRHALGVVCEGSGAIVYCRMLQHDPEMSRRPGGAAVFPTALQETSVGTTDLPIPGLRMWIKAPFVVRGGVEAIRTAEMIPASGASEENKENDEPSMDQIYAALRRAMTVSDA